MLNTQRGKKQATSKIKNIPPYTRGIYFLFKYRPRLNKSDVVYISMAAGTKTASIRGRLKKHLYDKGELWTRFSVFEVWENIREEEIIDKIFDL